MRRAPSRKVDPPMSLLQKGANHRPLPPLDPQRLQSLGVRAQVDIPSRLSSVKGKRHNDDHIKGATPGTKYTMSDSGWSNTAVFQEYIQEQFLPNVCGRPTSKQPVLLLLDEHSSHKSRSIIARARSHHIILQVFPAHTSHVLQPLDVSVFGPFKAYYYQETEHGENTLISTAWRKIACKTYLKAMTHTNVISGFN